MNVLYSNKYFDQDEFNDNPIKITIALKVIYLIPERSQIQYLTFKPNELYT